MALAMIEERSRVFVAHAEQRHGTVDVGVVTAYNMASRNVDGILALICQQALH